jgi:hypothetical protein
VVVVDGNVTAAAGATLARDVVAAGEAVPHAAKPPVTTAPMAASATTAETAGRHLITASFDGRDSA